MTPPIKCTPCRVNVNGTRYRIYSNGSVSLAVSNPENMTCGQVFAAEKELPIFEPHSEIAKIVRREASRLRRNRNARERNQAIRDMGMKKTAYGWE